MAHGIIPDISDEAKKEESKAAVCSAVLYSGAFIRL